jgi:hypothetical protein
MGPFSCRDAVPTGRHWQGTRIRHQYQQSCHQRPFRSGAAGNGCRETCRSSLDTRDRLLRHEKPRNPVGLRSLRHGFGVAAGIPLNLVTPSSAPPPFMPMPSVQRRRTSHGACGIKQQRCQHQAGSCDQLWGLVSFAACDSEGKASGGQREYPHLAIGISVRPRVGLSVRESWFSHGICVRILITRESINF